MGPLHIPPYRVISERDQDHPELAFQNSELPVHIFDKYSVGIKARATGILSCIFLRFPQSLQGKSGTQPGIC
jgi:hypothetical protein